MEHPKKWYIPVTSENREELSVWWRKKATESGWISDDKSSLDGGTILLSKHPYDDSYYWSLFEDSFISRYPSYQKITIEEFREIANTKPKPMNQTI